MITRMLERAGCASYAANTQAEITLLQERLSAQAHDPNISAEPAIRHRCTRTAGASIRLQAEEIELDGRVQYCCRLQRGYVVGIMRDVFEENP